MSTPRSTPVWTTSPARPIRTSPVGIGSNTCSGSNPTPPSALPFAQQLESDLAGLKTQMEGIDIPPEAMAVGASELIDEVSQGKITGEEDRYSHTDMWDLAANVDGSQKAIELLTPALAGSRPRAAAVDQHQLR